VLPKLHAFNPLRKKSSAVAVPAEPATTTVVVVRRAAQKRPFTQRAFGLFTFIMIPGFLMATTIPAIAAGTTPFGDDTVVTLATPKTSTEGQSISASAQAATVQVARSVFTADSHAQIVARQAAQARAGAYSTVGPQQAGDDYPWRASGGGLSPLGYVTRQCTDFVAWRINRDHGTTGPYAYVWANMTPNGGSASRWASAWNANGWQTSNTPVAGAVAYFGGHVAYVKSVNGDGTVNLEEYNWNGSASYHTRTIAASSVNLFLYPPP
jgi:surface antigen